MYTTADNLNARSWVIETIGKSRKNAFQLKKEPLNYLFYNKIQIDTSSQPPT